MEGTQLPTTYKNNQLADKLIWRQYNRKNKLLTPLYIKSSDYGRLFLLRSICYKCCVDEKLVKPKLALKNHGKIPCLSSGYLDVIETMANQHIELGYKPMGGVFSWPGAVADVAINSVHYDEGDVPLRHIQTVYLPEG
jgi:hypothetical protein